MSIHSGIPKRLMPLNAMNIQPLQNPAQLPVIDLENIRCRFRPFEILLLQTLMPKTESVPVPVQHLDHVSPVVAEYK